jgi:hypothetical protein
MANFLSCPLSFELFLTTPPLWCFRWAENLSNLLSDPDGVELYKNYLKTENVGELLDFW